MSKDDTLFVGFEKESGEEVEVPIFNTLTAGQTQLSGKTTVQKKFAEQLAEKDFKILIFDTKENLEDYSGIGKEIPICLRESTDPLVLLPLLESIMERRLPTGYFAVLSEVTSGTDDYCQVIERARNMEESSRSGWKKGACRTLWELLDRLQQQLAKVKTVSELKLPYKINRMVLNYFPRASQQLFLRNAFQDILRIHNKRTIPMLDEAYKFLPQKWGSACARSIQDVITQTAITKTYCFLATQFLAPTNKDPLKACAVRLLGTQDHKTEAKHTLDLIPFKGITTEDEIMRLPLGHFYVVTKKWAKLTYFLPSGVPKQIGIEVATGKKNVEYVRDTYLIPKKPEEEEIDMKRLEDLEKKVENLLRVIPNLKTLRTIQEDLNALKERDITISEALNGLKDIQKGVADLDEKFTTLKQIVSLKGLPKEELDAVFRTLQQILPLKELSQNDLNRLTELAKRSKTILNLEHIDLDVNLSHRQESVNMDTSTQQGQILYCAINDLPKEGFDEKQLSEAMKERGWQISHQSLIPTLSSTLPKKGLIIVIPTRPRTYRLPKLRKINVEEA